MRGKMKKVSKVPQDFDKDVKMPVEIEPSNLPAGLKVADENGILLMNLDEYSEMILDNTPIRERRGAKEKFYLADKRLAIRLGAQGYYPTEIAAAIEQRRRDAGLPVEGISERVIKRLLSNYKIEIDALRYLWRLQLGRFFKVADPIYRTRIVNSITRKLADSIMDQLNSNNVDKDLLLEIATLLKAFKFAQTDAGDDGSIKAFKYIINSVKKKETGEDRKRRLGID